MRARQCKTSDIGKLLNSSPPSKLKKDDPVYYKVELKKLFKNAVENGIKIDITQGEVSFNNNIGERTIVKTYI